MTTSAMEVASRRQRTSTGPWVFMVGVTHQEQARNFVLRIMRLSRRQHTMSPVVETKAN
jgi:hypothetical protein